jgi:hypothetical protein
MFTVAWDGGASKVPDHHRNETFRDKPKLR